VTIPLAARAGSRAVLLSSSSVLNGVGCAPRLCTSAFFVNNRPQSLMMDEELKALEEKSRQLNYEIKQLRLAEDEILRKLAELELTRERIKAKERSSQSN
jgi:hypothetical protein